MINSYLYLFSWFPRTCLLFVAIHKTGKLVHLMLWVHLFKRKPQISVFLKIRSRSNKILLITYCKKKKENCFYHIDIAKMFELRKNSLQCYTIECTCVLIWSSQYRENRFLRNFEFLRSDVGCNILRKKKSILLFSSTGFKPKKKTQFARFCSELEKQNQWTPLKLLQVSQRKCL